MSCILDNVCHTASVASPKPRNIGAALQNSRQGFPDPEKIALVVDMFTGGGTVTGIARTLHCDPHRVTKTLILAGVDVYGISMARSGASQRRTKTVQSADRRARGLHGPKFRVFTEGEQDLVVREFTTGKTAAEVAVLVGCCATLVSRILRDKGVDSELWRRRKISETHLATYRNGRAVPVSVGYGTKVRVLTPFQGELMMRSRVEADRAGYLTNEGVPWFYEVQRFTLGDGRTYLPDFWLPQCSMSEVQGAVGTTPKKADLIRFLASTGHMVEDVKGYWRQDHPSYGKIQTFRGEFPSVQFQITVKTKGGWSCQ